MDDDEPILYFYAHDGQYGGDSVIGEAGEGEETVRSRFVRRFGELPREVLAVTHLDTTIGALEGYAVWELSDEMAKRKSILTEVLHVAPDRIWDLGDGDFLRLQDHPEEGEDPTRYSVLTREEAIARVARLVQSDLDSPGEVLEERLWTYAEEQVGEHGFDYFLSHGDRPTDSGPYLIFRG